MRGMIFCKRCGTYTADGLDACPKCNVSLAESGHATLVGGVIMNTAPARGGSGAVFGSSSMEPAGHGQRILALIIDGLLLGLIVGIGGVLMFVLGESLGTTGLIVLLVVICIPLVVYEPYFIAANGATPGKSAMGLRVVNKDGGPVSVGQSIARFVLKNILNQFFIPLFVPLFTERRQGLHEMITSTYLVRS
jgi:uncharacterized RDD family membrane protein YckC